MSIKGPILFLLIVCALALASGPGVRRTVARALGLVRRPPRLRAGPDDNNAFRLGRLVGRLASRRGR